MTDGEIDVRDRIVAFKRSLAPRRDALKRAYADAREHVRRAADKVREDVAAGRPVVPELEYRDIKDSHVQEATRQAIRRTGCAVVRGVFPVDLARDWFAELGEYLEGNRYEQREVEKRSLDKYFSALKAGKPQIFNVYWSKPQVLARQDPKLAETRAFLDRLWRYERVFDPDRQCTYADRVRRRQPGDKTLGLSPHMDAGTVERWIDPGYQRVYEHIFAGDWRSYDPFDGTHRLATQEIPSPAVCSMFRTYQGWTALTARGRKTEPCASFQSPKASRTCSFGRFRTTSRNPISAGRRLAAPSASALNGTPTSYPAWSRSRRCMPGDTVFWHTDICHAVGDEHTGKEHASVIYIGSAPDCPKNRAYLPKQKRAFLEDVRRQTLRRWISKWTSRVAQPSVT